MDMKSNEFVKHDCERRRRVIALTSDTLIIDVLRPQVDIEKIIYKRHAGHEIAVADGSDWHLGLSHL